MSKVVLKNGMRVFNRSHSPFIFRGFVKTTITLPSEKIHHKVPAYLLEDESSGELETVMMSEFDNDYYVYENGIEIDLEKESDITNEMFNRAFSYYNPVLSDVEYYGRTLDVYLDI